MTQLDQSKHEPLARAITELVGDAVVPLADGRNRYTVFDPRAVKSSVILGHDAEEYISCKNLAGRVWDALRPKVDDPELFDELYGVFQRFPWAAFDDTPQALWDIMKAARRLKHET